MAPFLADRVAVVEAALYAGSYDVHPLDEALLLGLHHRICGDLVPEWAGKWRSIEVRVGNLRPALPFQLPQLMRDYVLDLQARWASAAKGTEVELMEFLSFAEGRFLTIHPFQDFNGRTIRLFLTELLRRLDLPRVTLAPEGDTLRHQYFQALEAADQHDWQPLMKIWEERFTQIED